MDLNKVLDFAAGIAAFIAGVLAVAGGEFLAIRANDTILFVIGMLLVLVGVILAIDSGKYVVDLYRFHTRFRNSK